MANQVAFETAEPLTTGIVLYPGFTLLDVAGPQAILGAHGRTYLFWKTLDPLPSDTGVSLLPTTSFADFEGSLDVLMVPGGAGTNDAMRDDVIVDFVARTAASARYVTSVCTGSLILGMAGLLAGRHAATHWAFYDVLKALGAVPVEERVVIDGDRFTGGGITAGIDFGLRLLAELRGEEVAKVTQLMLEYDPDPPFDAGHPRKAAPEIVAAARIIVSDAMVAEGLAIAAGRRMAVARTNVHAEQPHHGLGLA